MASTIDSGVLSPRRLEKIRQNGQDIMSHSNGFQNHTSDAHKNYANTMKYGKNKPIAAAHNISRDVLDMELDLENQGKMHLVPCRWSRSGWKYVEVDPKDHQFFKNPNRVNSFGVPDPKRHRRGGSCARKSYLSQKSGFSEMRDNGPYQTSYGRSFASQER